MFSRWLGEPILGEGALDGDHDIVAVGSRGFEKRLGSGRHVAVRHDFALGIEDAEVHGASVQSEKSRLSACPRPKGAAADGVPLRGPPRLSFIGPYEL